jgi:hypothetical protein
VRRRVTPLLFVLVLAGCGSQTSLKEIRPSRTISGAVERVDERRLAVRIPLSVDFDTPNHGLLTTAGEGWVEIGPVSSIDPGTGTTPTDILAAVCEDVGGTTLHRIVGAMTAGGVTTTSQSDGSALYRGTVPAGQIARQTGFKEGQAIRVFPLGYVAHDAPADPGSLLATAVTVGSDGVIREIAVTWGTWTYTVTYRDLGSTPPLTAPANAKSLRGLRHFPPKP